MVPFPHAGSGAVQGLLDPSYGRLWEVTALGATRCAGSKPTETIKTDRFSIHFYESH